MIRYMNRGNHRPHHSPRAIDLAGPIDPVHLDIDDLVNQAAQRAMRRNVEANERIIRRLLGQWVSELEPVIFVRQHDGRIMGLGAKGQPAPTILDPYAHMRRSLSEILTGRVF